MIICNDRGERREQRSWVTATHRLDGGHHHEDARGNPMPGCCPAWWTVASGPA